MKLIDLRKYTAENFKIIKVLDEYILFAREERKNDQRYLVLFKYNILNKSLKKLGCFRIEKYLFYESEINIFGEDIYLAIRENNELVIRKVNLSGNSYELNRVDIDSKHYSFCRFLSQDYLLIYSVSLNVDDKDFDVQKDREGLYDETYLCNLITKEKYKVHDKRIVLGYRDYLFTFKRENKMYLFLEEAYMEDWELEELYIDNIAKEKFYRGNYRESINIIGLDEFIADVINKKEKVSFNEIHKTELTSWTRYLGMDELYIYYRVKNFQDQIETIWKYNKISKTKEKVTEIDHNSYLGDISIDTERKSIYEILEKEKQINISGIYNFPINIKYPKFKGDFCGLLKDKLITWFWEEDAEENYYSYTLVTDITTGKAEKYAGNDEIYNDYLILY